MKIRIWVKGIPIDREEVDKVEFFPEEGREDGGWDLDLGKRLVVARRNEDDV